MADGHRIGAGHDVAGFVRSFRQVLALLVDPRPLSREALRVPGGEVPGDGIEVLWHDESTIAGDLPHLAFRFLTRDERPLEVIVHMDTRKVFDTNLPAAKRYVDEKIVEVAANIHAARAERHRDQHPILSLATCERQAGPPGVARKPIAALLGKASH